MAIMTEIFAYSLGQNRMQKNPLKMKCEHPLLLSSVPQITLQMEASSVTVIEQFHLACSC